MITIAHRGNIFGKTDEENQLLYLLKAVKAGFGVETDLLRAPCGELIISHDPVEWTPLNDAQLVLRNLMLNDAFIALNIKGEGLLDDLTRLICGWDMKGFVFDFELCCSNPRREMEDYKSAGFKVAERYSDRGEYPSNQNGYPLYEYVWIDEMDKSGSLDVAKLKRDFGWRKKIVYVSPELHGRPVSERRKEDFYGICTDYCMAL